MARAALCKLDDLPDGACRTFEVNDVPVVVARSGGTVFALEDRCSHDDGELGDGVVYPADGGGEIQCPRHGARFDLASGRATRMPAVAPVDTFEAGVDGDEIWVDVPEDF